MEVFGIISNPQGPLGLSILAWGAILVTTCSISIIIQLWYYIFKIDSSYANTLSFDKLETFPVISKNFQLAMLFSNTSDRPIEYKLDHKKISLIMNDKNIATVQHGSIKGIIAKQKSTKFLLPEIPLPKKYPAHGTLYYELEYGRPNKLKFRQTREIDLELITLIQQGDTFEIPVRWRKKHEEDKPIKKYKKDK